jgi:hypothetical protein
VAELVEAGGDDGQAGHDQQQRRAGQHVLHPGPTPWRKKAGVDPDHGHQHGQHHGGQEERPQKLGGRPHEGRGDHGGGGAQGQQGGREGVGRPAGPGPRGARRGRACARRGTPRRRWSGSGPAPTFARAAMASCPEGRRRPPPRTAGGAAAPWCRRPAPPGTAPRWHPIAGTGPAGAFPPAAAAGALRWEAGRSGEAEVDPRDSDDRDAEYGHRDHQVPPRQLQHLLPVELLGAELPSLTILLHRRSRHVVGCGPSAVAARYGANRSGIIPRGMVGQAGDVGAVGVMW